MDYIGADKVPSLLWSVVGWDRKMLTWILCVSEGGGRQNQSVEGETLKKNDRGEEN